MECLPLLVSLLLSAWISSVTAPCTLNTWSGLECPSDPRMNPVLEQFQGHDFIWQIPDNPKAVMIFAHGGERLPHQFFDAGPNCASCYGLPEERLALLHALDRDYAVIAMKSQGDGWGPIWPPEKYINLLVLRDLVLEWTGNHSLDGLPLFAFGHSSGGSFVTIMPSMLPMQAVVAMCSFGDKRYFESIAPGHSPPIFFVTMNVSRADVGDAVPTVEKLEEMLHVLKAKGIPTVKRLCSKKQVSAEYLSDRIRCMSYEMAENVRSALASERWLDEDGYVIVNPAIENWVPVIRRWQSLPECEAGDAMFLESDVTEELTRAYGLHSFTSEMNDEVFDWLDSIAAGNGRVVPSHSSSRLTGPKGQPKIARTVRGNS